MESGKIEFNFENVSEINKDKSKQQDWYMIEPQDLVDEEQQVRKPDESVLREKGEAILYGNRVDRKNQEDGEYRHVAFATAKVQVEIAEKVKNKFADYFDPNVSYQEATKEYLRQKKGDRAKELKDLGRLADVYGRELTGKKQKKELARADKLFAKIDKIKDKLKNETDQKIIFQRRLEIIQLKANALECRARAYIEDEAYLNDEIANIQIAANYEMLEAGVRYGTDGVIAGTSQLKVQQQNLKIEAEVDKLRAQVLKENIPKIILQRKRASGLEIFNAVAERRKRELLDLDDKGRVRADVQRNQKRADDCRLILAEYKLDEGSEQLDAATQESFKKKVSPKVEGALALRKQVKDFIDEINRNVQRISEGKPVVETTRNFLNQQYVNMVTLCNQYLKNNKKEEQSTDLEKESFTYVENLKNKLTEKVGEKVSFSVRFAKLADQFDAHRRHTWTSFQDKEEEAIIVGLEAKKIEGKKQANEALKVKSLLPLQDEVMKDVLGNNEEVKLADLREKHKEIEIEEKEKIEDLRTLEYNIPAEPKWAYDSNLLAIDAVLRSQGIYLKGGVRTLLKAVPKEVKNMTDVLAHFDKVLFKHDALKACWPVLKELLGNKYELVHEESVVPGVKDNAEVEHDLFNDALAKKIEAGLKCGSAVMLYDSVSRHYVTITDLFQIEKTYYITYLDDTREQGKEKSGKDVKLNDFLKDRTHFNQKFTIEYLREKTEEERKAEEKKEEKKNEEIVDAEFEKAKSYYETLIEICENNKKTSKMVSGVGKSILKLMKTVKYTRKELEAGTVYDKLYEEMRQLEGWMKVYDNECDARIEKFLDNSKEKITPIPSLIDKIEEIRKNMLRLIDWNTTDDQEVVKIMSSLKRRLQKINFAELGSFTAKCNGLFEQDECDNVTQKAITDAPNMSNTFLKEKKSSMSYISMLDMGSAFEFIVDAHRKKEEDGDEEENKEKEKIELVSLADLEKFRDVNYIETNVEREKLVSNTQAKNNCWACSVDVLLQSRGIKLFGGYKSVMQYLPSKIRTMREAAQYYAFITNEMYSPAEHSEFIEKAVRGKYSLESQTYYPDDYREKNKSQADFEEDIMKEIKKAIEDGSAISVRDPKRKHYITITGLSKDGKTFTLVDSNDNLGQPQQIAVKDYFKNMFDNGVNNNPRGDAVILSWLKKNKKQNK